MTEDAIVGVVDQWPIAALFIALGGLVYRIMSAQHERHAAAIEAHIARMDARDARLLDIVAAHTAALQGIGGTLAQLANVDRLEKAIREGVVSRHGGNEG